MFETLLIANRGEIACRVIRTASRMGIRTVAVYSEADADAAHVALADEAHLIGGPRATDSYLLGERILEAAKASGAQAIHPGYGFLAENAGFAEACTAAGIAFVGPPAAAIRAMGLKDEAKRLMQDADVPVVPGYLGEDQDPETLAAAAAEIGYPVLIKAVAGGGGKGMRRVDSADEFGAALEGAKREAASAFANDQVLIEKCITKPRHIEIQVFADTKGNAVHLFERDCSLQRRHQKVIEEAPAPGMTESMRNAMGEAAVAAAKAIGYVGAGTVEFIADVADGLKENAFYFMEMNTRLQVEHPVTEMITGQDLVAWQLKAAAGEALPLAQDELEISGHAVEVRLYAEDPARDFLPQTGRLVRLRLPEEDAHLRVDAGVREGDVVSVYYDPMIAKVIAWDQSRNAALRRLTTALAAAQVAGVTTNIAFLNLLAGHPAFAAADLDTGFIDRYRADLVPAAGGADDRVLALACLELLLGQTRDAAELAARSGDPYSPWGQASGWRLNDDGHTDFRFLVDDEEVLVTAWYAGDGYRLDLPGGTATVRGTLEADGSLSADIDGARVTAAVVHQGDEITVMRHGHTHRLRRHDLLAGLDLDEEAGGTVAAPLPGKVVKVMVAAGDTVAKGTPLLILEAMKMEHTIAAPGSGVVEAVHYADGDQVEEGAVMIDLVDSEAG